MVRSALRAAVVLAGSTVAGSLVVFLLLRLLGGDVASIILGTSATPERLEALRGELGLDRPWVVQYADWLSDLARGDLGHSYASGYDISQQIQSRLGLTIIITVVAMAVASSVALIAGTYSALHVGRLRGTAVDVTAQLGIAVPSFWVGLLLIGFFSVRLGWLPAGGYVPWYEDPVAAIRSLTLPVLALSIPVAAVFTRYVRSSMLDVLSEDFIRTARAKGRTLQGAAFLHGVRNASVSLVTIGTLQLGTLIAGTVVIENVFTLPGLGNMLMDAILGREAIVVQSTVFVILVIVLVMNFLMDLSYVLLDPRMRDGQRGRADA